MRWIGKGLAEGVSLLLEGKLEKNLKDLVLVFMVANQGLAGGVGTLRYVLKSRVAGIPLIGVAATSIIGLRSRLSCKFPHYLRLLSLLIAIDWVVRSWWT